MLGFRGSLSLRADFMEERKENGVCDELPAREDMISKLPDSLLSQILSYLPTKEAVRTSVLSDRWKSLWLLIPKLDLASYEFPEYNEFVSFMDKTLDLYGEDKSCLQELKLIVQKDENDQSCVTRWIHFVATRKLKHLDVECLLVKREFFEMVPVSLYICETLLYLRLHRVFLGGSESVYLPRLKTMCLEENVYASEAILDSLLSSCPVLEDLSIVRCVDDNVKVLRVISETITTLTVGFELGQSRMWFYYFHREILGLFIDAPRLKYLNFNEDVSKCEMISTFRPTVKLNLGGVRYISYFSDGAHYIDQRIARHFVNDISRVRDLVISENSIKIISACLKVEPFPRFPDLSCLEAKVCLEDVEIVSTLLESCPNLKSFVLDMTHPTIVDMDQIIVWSVAQCLLSSLEFVEIKCCCKGELVAMNLARYFAENSVILKKLVLRWRGYVLEEDSVLRDLLAFSWRSSNCHVEVCGPLKRLVGGF